MLLSSRPPHPPHLTRGGAAAPAPAPFVLVLRRRRRHHHHRLVPRASLADLIASLPSSLTLVGPAALAAAAAVATSLSSRSSPSSSSRTSLPPPPQEPDRGLRRVWGCRGRVGPLHQPDAVQPSVSFEDANVLLDGVNGRLLAEERHYVNLSRGCIPTVRGGDGSSDVSYQRVCVALEDGRVMALDWPDSLDLGREHGLNSTLLVVPGTP